MLFYDAAADPEAKAGAQFPFGGKEGLEDLVQMALEDTRTTIRNRYGGTGPAVGIL